MVKRGLRNLFQEAEMACVRARNLGLIGKLCAGKKIMPSVALRDGVYFSVPHTSHL